MSEETVLYERRGAGAWLTLNRPQALNTLDLSLVHCLDSCVNRAEADARVRAIVITGAGRAFSAGADLKAIRHLLADGVDRFAAEFVRPLLDVLDRLETSRLPVIAAVNGIAAAGGLETILACDLVIAAESARIGDAHANYGLIPGGAGSIRLPRKIGPTRAKALLFTGRFLAARELMAMGLVNQVVADEALATTVEELVAEIAAKSPLSIAAMKQLVRDGLEQSLDTAIKLEYTMLQAHMRSEDVAEGLDAFEHKRRPEFKGR